MSFSGEVKKELEVHYSKARHCRIAEIMALFSVCGNILQMKSGRLVLNFSTENLTVAKKYFMLIRKTFDFFIETSVSSGNRGKRTPQVHMKISEPAEVQMFLKACKILDESGNWIWGKSIAGSKLIQQNCCKRAFIRGLFLASGSVTDPNYGYHFEIVLGNWKWAEEVTHILEAFSIEAKITERKKNYVVYIKEGAQIVDLLNIMEAHIALMNFENVRILKEMRNSINRKVNCETANIKKTVSAASKQVEDIYYIKEMIGFGTLSKGLADIAGLRIEHPEASLKELGEMLDSPIGKSGVNHRLRKLSEIANELRLHKEEKYDNKEH